MWWYGRGNVVAHSRLPPPARYTVLQCKPGPNEWLPTSDININYAITHILIFHFEKTNSISLLIIKKYRYKIMCSSF